MRPAWLCIAVLALAGCGSTSDARPEVVTDATPPLGRAPAEPGEIVVRGQASPRSDGPYDFDGRYLVRFEQVAPEDPRLDFASQVPFTAALTRRAGDSRGARELFAAAAASGRTTVTARGRFYLEVSFGDFPYVVRFTPRRR